MKRITLLVLLFAFGFAFAVLSEDLGELAKKEKARREAIDKAGKKAKVFTNEDIGNLKSQTAMQSSAPEGQAATNEDTSYYTPPVEGQDYVSPQEPVQQREDPAAERQNQIRELEDKRDELEEQAKEARETVGAGGLWHSRNTGDQYRKAREAEAELQKVDKQIDETRSKSNQRQEAPVNQPQVEEYVPPEEAPAPAEEPASDDTTNEEPPI